MIKLAGVKKDYWRGQTVVHALKPLDLRIESGEFVAVWGPSGSGKTTLLNLLGTLDLPTDGQLYIGGQSVCGLTSNQRSKMRSQSIGFVFQHFNLIPVLSAIENVMLPLQIKGVSHSEARKAARALLHEVGLQDVICQRPDKMSGGQQQRVALARAMINAPMLIIADEPTANLDTDTAFDIIHLMQRLNTQAQTTFVFSTHDQRLLDRVHRQIRLEDGELVADTAASRTENPLQGQTERSIPQEAASEN